MTEALKADEIDGFIAGEPWNTAATAEGLAEFVFAGVRIWQRGVEKVLALRKDWMEANAVTVDRLLIALSRSAAWCDDPANKAELAGLLARADFIMFGREASGFPWRSQALWIYSQFVRWGLAPHDAASERAAAEVFRSDIYRRALGASGQPMPGASLKLEGALTAPLAVGSHAGTLTLGPDRFFDGRVFDPDHLGDYIADFGAH